MAFAVPKAQERERTPTAQEKAYMVRTVHRTRLELNGHTPPGEIERQLTELRTLFAEVFSCAIERVNAITAWAKIRAAKSNRKPTSPSEAKFIRSYVSLGTDQTERQDLKGELTEMLRRSPDVIDVISEGMNERRIDDLAADTRFALSHILTDIEHWEPTGWLEGGEHTDYGTEIKELWRAELERFLGEHTPAELRHSMRVLCLPGKDCLEIPLYLRLGFKPEHILGVEGGDRIARAEFEINARKYGIQPARARLEDILPQMRERFDVVSLDFTGPISPVSCQIAEQILLKERAYVMVNTLQKRENRDMIRQLEQLHLQSQELARHRRMVVHEHQRTTSGDDSLVQDEETTEAFSLPTFRGRVSPLIASMGINRRENWQVLASRVQEIPLADEYAGSAFGSDRERCQLNLQYHLQPILLSLIETLKRHGFCKVEDLEDVFKTINIGQMVFNAVFGKSFVAHLQKQSYRSKTGSKEATFHTDMAVVRTPRSLYEDVSGAVEFILKALFRTLQITESESVGTVLSRVQCNVTRGRDRQFISPGNGMKNDHLRMMLDGETLASIRVSDMLQAAANHYAVTQKYKDDDWERQAEIDRGMIEKTATIY